MITGAVPNSGGGLELVSSLNCPWVGYLTGATVVIVLEEAPSSGHMVADLAAAYVVGEYTWRAG